MPRASFDLQAPFQPAGDQPKAIDELSAGLERGDRFQTLLGVTGSGKTMTVANVIKHFGRPTLVLSHNKTLAAQLYGELKSFFPHNAVEYFISYNDHQWAKDPPRRDPPVAGHDPVSPQRHLVRSRDVPRTRRYGRNPSRVRGAGRPGRALGRRGRAHLEDQSAHRRDHRLARARCD